MREDKTNLVSLAAVLLVAMVGVGLMVARPVEGKTSNPPHPAAKTPPPSPLRGEGAGVLMLASATKPPGWSGGEKNPSPGEAPPSPSRGEGGEVPEEVDALVRAALGREPVVGEQAAVELVDGSTITIEWTDLGWVREHESGSGVGAGASFSGDKLVTDFTGSAPSVGVGGVLGGSSASSSEGSALVWGQGKGGTAALLIAGALLVVGAGAGAWFLRSVKFGLVFGGIGGLLIAIGLYPALALWGVLLAIAAAVVYALRSDALALRFRETTRALTGAIDHPLVDEDAKRAVAGALAMEADGRDLKTITKVRADDAGLKFAGTV